ncbi:TAXI family TRAP transporter solute-binding subunit [Undibacterium fentianense]|uniref:ABC transporter substrate-binding protein n=1 Tax=Undibacterium fentianense TaxID=2828728 RepID=A0A941E638_9BURK|nr:TAXI family TRAP transporter solute-binding subunit [Undibacterium fentianense]MBR7801269.1 ABC transporter substrate-binding protein [Undibacterium fentianense]
MAKIKFTLFSLKDAVFAFGPIALLLLAIVVSAYYLVDPAPGRTLDFSAGQENSAYEIFAKQYSEELAKNQIALRVHQSQGSQENLEKITDLESNIDIGFVQSGSTNQLDAEARGLISLGSLFYEPIWIFYRSKKEWTSFEELRGKRINVGPDGFGVRRLFRQLLSVNSMEESEVQLQQDENTPATVAFIEGKLDALVMSSAPDSLLIQMLLQTPGVRLFDFAQAEAYTRRFPFLSHVILPRGIVDIGKNIPARDYHLISPTATLVAHESLHPALISLFLQAAKKIHGGANWLSRQGEFPSDRYTEIAVEKQAEKFYKSGPPFLQRYLSFWMSNFLERMWVVLLAFGALALPLSKIIPPLYVWRIRSRIYRWYGQLRSVEHAIDEANVKQRKQIAQDQMKKLDEIEARVNQLSIPLSYAEELYGLRSHINFVRQRVEVCL